MSRTMELSRGSEVVVVVSRGAGSSGMKRPRASFWDGERR